MKSTSKHLFATPVSFELYRRNVIYVEKNIKATLTPHRLYAPHVGSGGTRIRRSDGRVVVGVGPAAARSGGAK
jgi:hypothetical protein